MKGIEVHIRIREGASPIYFKSHPVLYALREAVEAELNKPEENGVIVKVDRSDWASPIVCVYKVALRCEFHAKDFPGNHG